MAYRNGTYIAFHGEGLADPTASDIRYYYLLKGWHEHDDISFRFVNSHEKASALRSTSANETIRRSLVERFKDSKNMVLIIGPTTKFDTDWVPFEIEHAVDKRGIPIIAAYTSYNTVIAPNQLSHLWPEALNRRILNGTALVVHVPFKQKIIDDAIRRFDLNNLPGGPLVHYTVEAHRGFGIIF